MVLLSLLVLLLLLLLRLLGEHDTLSSMLGPQGAIIVSALVQMTLGFSGIFCIMLRYISPISIAPTVAIIGTKADNHVFSNHMTMLRLHHRGETSIIHAMFIYKLACFQVSIDSCAGRYGPLQRGLQLGC